MIRILLLLLVACFANAVSMRHSDNERELKQVGNPHGLVNHVPLTFVSQPSKPASTTSSARASKKGTTTTINYVSANKFSTKDCSGSSTLVGLVQNTCIPNFDLSTSPPTQIGYQVYTVSQKGIVMTDYAMSDTTCKGAASSAPQTLVPGRCYPISATLSYTFSSGSTPSTLPTVHGLFYASYSTLAACQKLDVSGLVAISQLTSTYSVPSQFWNQPIKLTCAAPDLVEIVALPPSTTPAAKLNLGKCSTEAAGGYAIRLGCYL